MSTLASKKIESRYITYQQDGLLDIFIGLGIAFAGLFLWAGLVWLVGIFVPVFTPTFQAARRRFVQTRIGYQDQNPRGQVQTQKLVFSITLLLGILFLAGIMMFLAYDMMSGAVNAWLRQHFLLVLGAIFGSVWVFAGTTLKNVRFYAYGAFTFAVLCAAQFGAVPFWLALTILGGIIVIVGLLMLFRFLRRYPAVE